MDAASRTIQRGGYRMSFIIGLFLGSGFGFLVGAVLMGEKK